MYMSVQQTFYNNSSYSHPSYKGLARPRNLKNIGSYQNQIIYYSLTAQIQIQFTVLILGSAKQKDIFDTTKLSITLSSLSSNTYIGLELSCFIKNPSLHSRNIHTINTLILNSQANLHHIDHQSWKPSKGISSLHLSHINQRHSMQFSLFKANHFTKTRCLASIFNISQLLFFNGKLHTR